MFNHNKTILAVIVLLSAIFAFVSCNKDKQSAVTVSPSSLTLPKDETKNVSVTFQNITAYHFAIEDTLIAKFVTNSSHSIHCLLVEMMRCKSSDAMLAIQICFSCARMKGLRRKYLLKSWNNKLSISSSVTASSTKPANGLRTDRLRKRNAGCII